MIKNRVNLYRRLFSNFVLVSNTLSTYNELIAKLDEFIRRFYKNQLIKGAIYSLALLLSYFLLTVLRHQRIFFLLLLVFISCSTDREQTSRVHTLPYYEEATFTPRWLSTDSKELKDFHQIPAFQLLNQNGDTITEQTFKDKIYVVDFFFTTCPGICPKMTASMGDLQAKIKDLEKVVLMSHSVMPRYDSVEVLKEYALENGVQDDKWHLVTGERDHIYALGRNSYFVEEDLGLEKEADDFLHTENFVLIDKQRHIRGIYNGLNKVAVNQLFVDIKTLLEEK